MFKFIGGFVLGAASLYFYSSKVRKDAKEANREIEELLKNQDKLQQACQEEINRALAKEAGKGMFSRYIQRPVIDAEYKNY